MRKSLLTFVFIFLSLITVFTGCAIDPYKDYVASGLEVKEIPFDIENEKNWSFGFGQAEIFTDYQAYSKYDFYLDYMLSVLFVHFLQHRKRCCRLSCFHVFQ